WVTLPFVKDGESEFLEAGDLVYAGIRYNNYHDDMWDRRNKNIGVGVDMSVPLNDPVAIGWDNGDWFTGVYVTKRNPMIRLNLNDHNNLIDGVDLNNNLSSLSQNYPNPFRNSTEISYQINSAEEVVIEITDITGRIVMTIEEGQKPAGEHVYQLLTDQLDSGIYFYTLKAGNFTKTMRMIISD
ncbi:MAG: T9SS type A sorting domain-containing protein, partial [Bacteroidota bacterium]|nr:T9SS type A sorting domain-containing protein [Bacteroidota bacterium]